MPYVCPQTVSYKNPCRQALPLPLPLLLHHTTVVYAKNLELYIIIIKYSEFFTVSTHNNTMDELRTNLINPSPCNRYFYPKVRQIKPPPPPRITPPKARKPKESLLIYYHALLYRGWCRLKLNSLLKIGLLLDQTTTTIIISVILLLPSVRHRLQNLQTRFNTHVSPACLPHRHDALITPTLGGLVSCERCYSVPGHRLQHVCYVRGDIRSILFPVQNERVLHQLIVFRAKTLVLN